MDRGESQEKNAVTASDWERIRLDTERAIEHMRRLIEIAEAGKKRARSNSTPAEPENNADGKR